MRLAPLTCELLAGAPDARLHAPELSVAFAAPLRSRAMVAVVFLVAKVWHYWLSVALLAPIVLGIIAMAALYVVKVMATKYPRQ